MNPKLIDLAPTWAPYRGWSVLFAMDRPTVPTCTTYDRLHGWFAQTTAPHPDQVGLAALPRSTFHVTVCDGPNETMLARTSGHRRETLATTLDALPHDVVGMGETAALERLVNAASAPIELRVTGIAARGTAVLAELEPTTDSSRVAEAIRRERHHVLVALGEALGLDLVNPWRPHVTLAYAEHAADAQSFVHRARAPISALIEEIAPSADLTLRFDGAAVTAFDDMITFRPTRR